MADGDFGLHDMYNLVKDKYKNSGIKFKDVFNACTSLVISPFKSIGNFIHSKLDLRGKVDSAIDLYDAKHDNLKVRFDEKTILGSDFKNLYSKEYEADTITTVDSAGNSVKLDYININSEADSMCGTNMKFSSLVDFRSLPMEKRVAYEVTLVSKKYARGEYLSDPDGNPFSYEGVIDKYKKYCTANNIDWNIVTYVSSEELQSESKYATERLGRGLWTADNAANLRYNANSAHNLILSVAPEGYVDRPISGIDYEKTLDTTAVPYGYFKIKMLNKENSEEADKVKPFDQFKENAWKYIDDITYMSAVDSVYDEMIKYNEAHGVYDTVTKEEAMKEFNSRHSELAEREMQRNEEVMRKLGVLPDDYGTRTSTTELEQETP